jgi:3-methyladenine DNA glycosylase AlkD
MDKTEVMRKLEALGTAQNRKVYARHGVTGEQFGVSFANLNKLRKAIGTDHELAEELWASGNHDARILAAMVADPARMNAKTCAAWVKGVGNHVSAAILGDLVARGGAAMGCFRKWSKSADEWQGATAWNLLATLARDASSRLGDADCEQALRTIEQRIHTSENRTRYAMNSALIAIGVRNAALRRKALAAAKRIGKVEVDHGETGCKTPDAATYIARTVAHHKSGKARAKARKKPAARKRKARA